MREERLRTIHLQYFGGGRNLTCQACLFWQQSWCELQDKSMDKSSEACSRYLSRRSQRKH
ncbi:MAG: hypothetical protein GX060_04725 [Firmicutes bacterium]|nr:hypothetical protein [Bacillota bacterium]